MLKRDISLFLREPSQWLHLLLMFMLLCIFLFSLGALRMSFEEPATRAAAFMSVFMFNGFLIASISLRFVFPLVSLEGDAFWTVRTSPLHVRKLFWYKTFVAFFCVSLVAQCLSFASVYMFEKDILLTIVTAIATLFMTLTLVGLNVGAGGYFAMYREKNAMRVASSQGASLTFLASMVYLTAVVSIFMVPLTKFFIATDLAPQVSLQWAYGPLGLIGDVYKRQR